MRSMFKNKRFKIKIVLLMDKMMKSSNNKDQEKSKSKVKSNRL